MQKRSFNTPFGLGKGDGKIKLAGAKGADKLSFRTQEGMKSNPPVKKASKKKNKCK